MIYQCYFDPSQISRLFRHEPYVGFGLYSTVNPSIAKNCPELVDPAVQAQLSEYAAMLHHWRNPHLDGDDWIGFTSYRQLEKFPLEFQSKSQVQELLSRNHIVAWGGYRFFKDSDRSPLMMAAHGESAHPGITNSLCRLLDLAGESIPLEYLAMNQGLYCNYWAMSKELFELFMQWSYPLIKQCLDRPDAYVRSHPRALSYLVERLFICWYLNRDFRIHLVEPIKDIGFNIGPARRRQPEERFICLPAWTMTLHELCYHHRIPVHGIVHIGAHYGQERDFYRIMGATKVLWIEGDPNNMPQLQSNIAGYAGHRAVQACLSDVDDSEVTFYRSSNRGESSSILPMKKHLEQYPSIQVVDELRLKTTTFEKLVAQENIDIAEYELLVLDVQGAELKVLNGFGDQLQAFKAVYMEVNLDELYEGCALLGDVDDFLGRQGFERRETLIVDKRYGDALYVRPACVPKSAPQLKDVRDWAVREIEMTRAFRFHWLGNAVHELELLTDGRMPVINDPHIRRWQVRVTGQDVVLELTGDFGRSFAFYLNPDGIWRGSYLFPPFSIAQLIPRNLTSKLAPVGFPYQSNLSLEFVERLRDQLQIRSFVETGTFQGATAKAMSSRFAEVYTVEASPELYQAAAQSLAAFPNINCMQGGSVDRLPEILGRLDGPAIFWLDAHWCGQGTGLIESECPLLKELELIYSHRADHVVLIDDARLFLEKPQPPHRAEDWPSFTDICNFATRVQPMPIIQLLGDVIFLGPRSVGRTAFEQARTTCQAPADFEVTYPWI